MWYHGSKVLVPVLERRKAWAPPGTLKAERLSAIYFTPDFPFALLSAVRCQGITLVDHDNRVAYFENLDKFDPQKEVYVYLIDPSRIPDDRKIWIGERQIAVLMDRIEPDEVRRYKAGEILQYYRLVPIRRGRIYAAWFTESGGRRIIADLMRRIHQQRTPQFRDPLWDKHDRTYTEWYRYTRPPK
jgi:hypothetical protein